MSDETGVKWFFGAVSLLELALDLIDLLCHQGDYPCGHIRQVVCDEHVKRRLAVAIGSVEAKTVRPLGAGVGPAIHDAVVKAVDVVVNAVVGEALCDGGVVILEKLQKAIDLLWLHLNGLEEDLLVAIEKEAVCPLGVLAAETFEVNRHVCGWD